MNLEEYLGGLTGRDSLQLVIVGKDPYPNDATGIPFCKTGMRAQFKSNCSGGIVLKALGCDVEFLLKKYEKDEEGTLKLFTALRDAGIVFLNVIYRTEIEEIGKRIVKKDDLLALKTDYERYNGMVLSKARRVIYCGEAKKIQWVEGAPRADDKKIHAVPHPDMRNSYSRHAKVRKKYEDWWSPGKLRRKLGLELPKGVTART